MEERIKALESTVAEIRERNKRVEADKAWEVSWTRISAIAIVTYVVAALVLKGIGVTNFYFAAIVPVVGFVLSTLSLSFTKKRWLEFYEPERHTADEAA